MPVLVSKANDRDGEKVHWIGLQPCKHCQEKFPSVEPVFHGITRCGPKTKTQGQIEQLAFHTHHTPALHKVHWTISWP